MPRQKRKINIVRSYIEGDIKIQQGDFVAGNKYAFSVTQWFSPIYRAIEAESDVSPKKKTQLRDQVRKIEHNLQKDDKVDKSFLAERLENIKKMSPDIWEIALTTLINPPSGLTLVIQKAAKKLAEQSKKIGEQNA